MHNMSTNTKIGWVVAALVVVGVIWYGIAGNHKKPEVKKTHIPAIVEMVQIA